MSRTVVVTGGAKGIGRAVVERFTALGDDVVALGRDREALHRMSVRTAVCDVTDEAAVASTFASLGRVDVLVNNAGFAETAPLARTTLESWGRHLDVNVTGPFLCMRAVVPGMTERGSGSIVTVASTAGRVGAPYTIAYTSSKHAAVGLTRAVASELAEPASASTRSAPPTSAPTSPPGRSPGSSRRPAAARPRAWTRSPASRRSAACSTPRRSPTRSCSWPPPPRRRSTARRW